jgi:signal transduction histidine kinase
MAASDDPARNKRGLFGLTHELANLTQVVSGNLELLDAHVTDDPARRYLVNARTAAEKLTELSRQLSTKTPD